MPVPDVILVQTDPKVTTVTMGSGTDQIVTGSTHTDQNGTRTATILIPAQTTAQLEMPSGATVSASNLSLRITEYTVGPLGPEQMPATLPPTSSYTYSMNITSDEGIAIGAQHILFFEPVPVYVDNYLGFATGTAVPIGSFNESTGFWDPLLDGRVINILSVQNGMAVLDVTGSGSAASGSDLTTLGISTDELTQLASFGAGKSLWRATFTRFSPNDWNFFASPPGSDSSTAPISQTPAVANQTPPIDDSPNSCMAGASSIIPSAQILMEQIPVVGTGFTLNYTTARAPGRAAERTMNVALVGEGQAIPPGLEAVGLEIDVAGQKFTSQYSASAGLAQLFTWDGNDAFGRALNAAQYAYVHIFYDYPANYLSITGSKDLSSFGVLNPGLTDTHVAALSPEQIEGTSKVVLGTHTAAGEMAGWLLSVHHFYDPNVGVLYLGDGSKENLGTGQTIGFNINRVIQDASISTIGDAGAPLDQGEFTSVYAAPDGSTYFYDALNAEIKKISETGQISVVAGNGTAGYSGDGGAATQAQINMCHNVDICGAMVYGSDGSLYFADASNAAIRKVGLTALFQRL